MVPDMDRLFARGAVICKVFARWTEVLLALSIGVLVRLRRLFLSTQYSTGYSPL